MVHEGEVIKIYLEVLHGSRKRFPNHFFAGVDGKERLLFITRYLIEDYLQIPISQIPEQVCAELLWNHRLRPSAQLQGWNFSELMENCYPEEFKAWDFRQVSNGYWQKEDGRKRVIEAVKFVIEKECQIPIVEIPNRITNEFFKEHNLYGAFSQFGQSTYDIIDAVYPGAFHPWQFHSVPMNYWKDPKNVEKAINWLLFDVLTAKSYAHSLTVIQRKHFVENRLQGLLIRAFHNRLCDVIGWISARSLPEYEVRSKIKG